MQPANVSIYRNAIEPLQPLISKAASWALRAVQRKPSPFSTPLLPDIKSEVA